MSNTRRNLLIAFALILTIVLSACTQSLSSAPKATPTVVSTNAFTTPLAGDNPMDTIAEFAAQTAAAQTAAAGGVPAVPTQTTPGADATTPAAPGTPTNAEVPTASAPNPTAVPSGARPATYTLQAGEHPYCIARRFNVDADALLSLNGISRAQAYSLPVGKALNIPQSGAFGGDRALMSHPTTYTVISGDETLYSIACKYGDVDPATIASLNGISVAAKLTVGQALQIP